MIIQKRKCHLASFLKTGKDDEGNPINIYDEPIVFECSLNSVDAEYEIAIFGDKVNKMFKTVLDYKAWINKIKEKDAIYLFDSNPDNEYNHGDNSNYFVSSVRPQNKKIIVYFEKRI